MTLKTLKDITHMRKGTCIVFWNDARELAIKWVKEMDKRMEKQRMQKQRMPYEAHSSTWIKHFFNISQEDLKEEN